MQKKVKKCAAFLFLLFLGISAYANQVHLGDGFMYVTPNECFTYEDSTNHLTIDDFVQMRRGEIPKLKDVKLNYNRNRSFTYWKEIVLVNNTSSKSWLLEFPDPHIENLALYVLFSDTLINYGSSGYLKDFDKRSLPHKNFVYEIPFREGETAVVFAKIKSGRYCGINTQIRSVNNFSGYFLAEYHLLGIYYGILMILMVYNFILGFFTKDKGHFYFCFYIVCCGLYTFAEDGLGFQWIWSNTPIINIYLDKAAPILLLFAFVLYANQFINLKREYPVLFAFVIVSSLVYVVFILFVPSLVQTAFLLYVVPFTIILGASVIAYKDGFRPARFFIAGNILIVFSTAVFFMRMKGWVPSNAFTVYLFNYGFLLESVVLSFSLADKVRNSQKNTELAKEEVITQLQINEELQHKVNKELETKVSERTKELQKKTTELISANDALEKLKKELYDMNSQMDLNIYKLKKEVSKEKEARILDSFVSYDEFKTLFTESKCYDFLRDIKWKEGFICAKCSNTKYGKGNNIYTLKCTKCHHQESVKANTFFQGLRFPIEKGFYLVYYFSKKGKDASYEDLAEKLELNKNTVWKFYKKYQVALEDNPKISSQWEALFLKK